MNSGARDDGPAPAAGLAEVVSLLAQAVERLDELAYDVLAEAVARGATARPELERRITRARNAVERAIGLIGGADHDEHDGVGSTS